ncbi:MAG: ATP-dependent Clp protease proteolytic subunit [Candidatus Hydrogenedentota bacterium]|nr:MAG: ATP-dependent Clp protease proteolytic subunit [Candidatus Hydrogenedentota bacterium]
MNMAKNDDKKSGRLKDKIAESFLKNRQIFIWGAIHDKSCEEIVEKLLYLEREEPGKPIYMFINSPGGVISAGMAVFDVMKMISSPVYTIVMGLAASMGAVLFAAGEKGHRYVFEHSKVMIHQPLISGQIVAPAIDIKIHAEEIKKTRAELNRILSEATGQDLKKIEKDTDRDFYMNAQEAVSYGIADKILHSLSDLEKATKKTARKKT